MGVGWMLAWAIAAAQPIEETKPVLAVPASEPLRDEVVQQPQPHDDGEPISLPLALEEALSANLELRREAVAVGLAETSLVRARGRWDPTLGLNASTSVSNAPNNEQVVGQDVLSESVTNWSASLGQELPSGGRITASWSESRSDSNSNNRIEPVIVFDRASLSLDQPLLRGLGPAALWDLQRNRLSVNRAQLGWRAAVEQSILDVSAAYWQLVAADQRWTLATQSRAIAEQAVTDMEERFAAGFVGTGDVLQMRRAFGATRQSEVSAEAARQQANNRLCRLLGRDVRRPPPPGPDGRSAGARDAP